MFMAAGLMAGVLGHDRIADLRGIGRALPVTVLAFVVAAVSLVGVPPSGGFLAKWLLLSASFASGQWWWAAVILTGALLAGGYMFRAFASAAGGFRGSLVHRGARPKGSRIGRAGPGDLRVVDWNVSKDPDRAPSDWASHSNRGSRCHDSRIPARWRYRPAACHVVCVRIGKREEAHDELALACSVTGAHGRNIRQLEFSPNP